MRDTPPAAAIRVLIVDDEADARTAAKFFLESLEWPCTTVPAATSDEAERRLREGGIDVVLCDVHLPDGSGIELVRKYPDTPFVMITGDEDARITIEAMRAGAFDYFRKAAGHTFLPLLALSVRRAVEMSHADRHRAMLSAAVQHANDAIFITDRDAVIVYANAACESIYGYPAGQFIGMRKADLRLGDGGTENWHRRRAGEPFPVQVTRSDMVGAQGETVATVSIVRDISEQKATEERIRAMLAEQERATEGIRHVFNQLRIGVMLADTSGAVSFVNQMIADLRCGLPALDLPRPAGEILALDAPALERLHAMLQSPGADGARLETQVEWPDGRKSWLEIEARAGYVDASQLTLFVHDHSEVAMLRRQLEARRYFGGMVGRSESIRAVAATIRQVAPLTATVLICGETGTGKELVARAIHETSPRSDGPFIAINCGALTESLLASQLFGHKRGAFTGAESDHAGFFEVAEGGTLLLDEIGDLPLPLQASLLRVLEQREILRIGDATPRPVNVRILAATNRDLEREIREGRFRSDLYYRVRAARITLPPLRERRDDIPLLVQHALQTVGANTGRPRLQVDGAAMRLLMRHSWPGNVRELNNVVEFAVMTSAEDRLGPANFPPEVACPPSAMPADGGSLPAHRLNGPAESARIREALHATGGNRAEAARLLGMSRATLYRRLEKLGIAE